MPPAPPPPSLSSHGPQDDDEYDDDNRGAIDEGDSFIAPARDAPLKKFGKEGTKKAYVSPRELTHTLTFTLAIALIIHTF